LHPTSLRGRLSARKQKLVVDFIEANIAEEISLARLAKLVDLSRYHFARAFRQTFGVPPRRYHLARRMERATKLLTQSTLPVTQIALRVGFRETSAFTRAYRKYAGVTPSDCRRDRAMTLPSGCLSD
jgi:AraC family transcriptional regulator